MGIVVALVFVAACICYALVVAARDTAERVPAGNAGHERKRPIAPRDRYTLSSMTLTPARLPDVFAPRRGR